MPRFFYYIIYICHLYPFFSEMDGDRKTRFHKTRLWAHNRSRKSGFPRFASDDFMGADSRAEAGAKKAETQTETRHEKMEYFLCTSKIFAVS